jgi:DNA repair protein RadC
MVNISFFSLKVVREKTGRYDIERKINNPQSLYDIATQVIEIQDQAEESMWMITLDTTLKVTGLFEISRGSLDSSIAHPREIYKRAILQNASSIALIHNHPSGDPTPSTEDTNITQRVSEAGTLLGIQLIDHLVIGDGNYRSMKEMGVI